MEPLVVLLGLAAPVLYALVRARGIGRADYLSTARRTSLGLTLAGVICGNIGIGTFIALFLFTAQSPVLGYAVALSYAAGLLLCAAMAGRIHAAARATGTYGLVDYLAAAHGLRSSLPIWVPVAVAFALRSIVQLMALGLILEVSLGLPAGVALACAGLTVGFYTAIGGYRVAVETDAAQAMIILLGMALAAMALFGGAAAPQEARPAFFDLGPWGLPFLVAAMLFLPFSVVLAVDNWQRMAIAENAATARRAYLAGAAVCGPVYLLLAHVGRVSGGAGDGMSGALDAFRALMPPGLPVFADLVVMMAVMSSIDTFVMPLMTGLARTSWGMGRIRLVVVGAFAVLTGAALGIGDALTGVIAAFNALVVFLPAVLGALVLGDRAPRAAVLSMGLGVAATLVLGALALDVAALAGFLLAAGLYAGLRPRGGRA
jgi:Na+/proline symporter